MSVVSTAPGALVTTDNSGVMANLISEIRRSDDYRDVLLAAKDQALEISTAANSLSRQASDSLHSLSMENQNIGNILSRQIERGFGDTKQMIKDIEKDHLSEELRDAKMILYTRAGPGSGGYDGYPGGGIGYGCGPAGCGPYANAGGYGGPWGGYPGVGPWGGAGLGLGGLGLGGLGLGLGLGCGYYRCSYGIGGGGCFDGCGDGHGHGGHDGGHSGGGHGHDGRGRGHGGR